MKRATEDSVERASKKRRVRFDEDTVDNEKGPSPNPIVKTPKRLLRKDDSDTLDILGRLVEDKAGTSGADADLKEKKHTLDSDEEDEKFEPKRLDIRSVCIKRLVSLFLFQVQGQEKATIEYDGSIKIMPFNMCVVVNLFYRVVFRNDEMEEGQYDEEGNYIFNKDKDDVRDEWLDNLDWDSAKYKAGALWNRTVTSDKRTCSYYAFQTEEDEGPVNIDGISACERILKYLDNKEFVKDEATTINDVLKKLNSQKSKTFGSFQPASHQQLVSDLSAAEERKRRWQAKKNGVEYKNEFSEFVNDLTGAVDDLISMGHMDSYSMNRQEVLTLHERLEIEKERVERAERTKREQEEAQKREVAQTKAESTANLIDDLMDDDDEEHLGFQTNEAPNQTGEEVSH